MNYKQISDSSIKYKLASLLEETGAGQMKIRNIYEEISVSEEQIVNPKRFANFRDRLKRDRVEIIAEWEDCYPRGLLHLSDRPLLFFIRGSKHLLQKKMITVVGTRKCTGYGFRFISDLVRIASEYDVVLVSGLAYGIDSAVHSECLKHDVPTIAVVAGGIDVGYPSCKDVLYHELVQKGLIIAEFPPSYEVCKGMFPLRNRILAALSVCTIVVEAPEKSGALITSSWAVELGREVYPLPGNIYGENSKGCNELIRSGANPIVSLSDIHEIFRSI